MIESLSYCESTTVCYTMTGNCNNNRYTAIFLEYQVLVLKFPYRPALNANATIMAMVMVMSPYDGCSNSNAMYCNDSGIGNGNGNGDNNNNNLLFKHDKNYSKADVVVYLHVIKSYLP